MDATTMMSTPPEQVDQLIQVIVLSYATLRFITI